MLCFFGALRPKLYLCGRVKQNQFGEMVCFCVLRLTRKHTHTVTAHLLALLVRPCLAHVAMATRPYSPMRKRPLPLCEVGQKQFLKCSRTKLEL